MKKTIYNIINVFLIAVVIVSVCSCGLYQKYSRPKTLADSVSVVRDPVDGNKYMSVSSDTTNFGDVDWHKVFTDKQLQVLIDTALHHNVDLLNATENIKMAEAQLKIARMAYLPALSFTPSGTLSKVVAGQEPYKSADWGKTYAMPVTASWSMNLFGGLLAQKRSAQAALVATRDYQQAIRSQLICGIANCYYSLLMLDRQLEIVSDMEKLTKDTWDMMKLQKELRGARETSVVAAEAAYYSVQSQEVDIKRSIRETENTLSLLLGQSAGAVSRSTFDSQSLPQEFSSSINIKLLSNRPDVHATEMSLAECFYGIKSARSSFYPSLSISATGSYTNSMGTQIVNPGLLLASFVGGLTQPIFTRGQLTAGLKVAKSQYTQAYNTWEHSLLSAGSEVSNALVLYNSSNEKSAVDQKRVIALTKSVSYTEELFKMGSSSYLEVITAQQNLLNAKLTKVTDDYNKMQAVVNLYSALGGGRK